MAELNPYLHFNGNTQEVFEFYKSVFGGEFMVLQRYKDAPPNEHLDKAEADWIMHIALPVGKSVLMASDRPSAYGKPNLGDSFFISINLDSEEETKTIFDKLSAGGKVQMPLEKTFWGAYFGMFSDKYGVQWMVNHDLKK